jgi:hypothetical protein
MESPRYLRLLLPLLTAFPDLANRHPSVCEIPRTYAWDPRYVAWTAFSNSSSVQLIRAASISGHGPKDEGFGRSYDFRCSDTVVLYSGVLGKTSPGL